MIDMKSQNEAKKQFMLMVLLMTVCASAFAQAVPGTTWLTNIQAFLTGPAGTSLAVIGLAIVGFMAYFGRMSWERAGGVMLGIIFVFGGVQIVTWVKGGIGAP